MQGAVHTKAAETGPLINWCNRLLTDFQVAGGAYLLGAGQALHRHMRVIKEEPRQMSAAGTQELLDTFLRHCACMKTAGAKFVPKHHLWCHLVLLAPINGNPRYYSTFLDESLNAVVAAVAHASHPATWEKRIFDRLQLAPRFGDDYFANFE